VSAPPRVSFGIIVFNGEPFTRYCLRALYPYAHEIIVVEGGHEGTAAVATPDGHSTDGTLAAVEAFIAEEDPDGKVKLVTRDGFWPMTDELGRRRTAQSRAYAELATGDYLWQVDIDEFYLPADMTRVLQLLATHLEITQMSFPFLDFWSRPDYKLASSKFLRKNQVHRLFKWGEGYTYVTHQPPIVHDDAGRDLRTINWVRPDTTARMGITMHHYSHLLPSQMEQKAHVYRGQEPRSLGESLTWLQDSYLTLRRPYRVERHYYWPSWLERYSGPQPPQIRCMMEDIASGRLAVRLRRVDDAERLLASRWYPLGAQGLRAVEPLRQLWRFASPPLAGLLHGQVPKRLRGAWDRSRSTSTRLATPGAARPLPVADEKPPPNVVCLAPYFEYPHGMAATNRLRLLTRALAGEGSRVRVISVLPSGRAQAARNLVTRGWDGDVAFEYLARSPLKAGSFAGRRYDEARGWASVLLRLLELRRAGELDAVYLWPRTHRWTWMRPVLIAMARLAGAPVALEASERPWSLTDRQAWLERRVSPLSGIDGVVAISHFLASWVADEALRTAKDVRVVEVPILVDPDEQTPTPYPTGAPLVVFAASPAYQSTVEFILEAMKPVWTRHPACRLVITGIDPDTDKGRWLRDLRAAGSVDARAELRGRLPRPALLELYQEAAALLAPLFDDTQSVARFPTKIGEYLAAGRPVVTSAVGEIPRYFDDGVNALLSTPGDAAAYGDKIAQALDDPEAAAAIGRAGRTLCETTFDYRVHGAALREFFAGLAAQRLAPHVQDGLRPPMPEHTALAAEADRERLIDVRESEMATIRADAARKAPR
jgi:glycosyltransferase involved in cell wall biosynthesis